VDWAVYDEYYTKLRMVHHIEGLRRAAARSIDMIISAGPATTDIAKVVEAIMMTAENFMVSVAFG
jgi:hypothetical protein